MKIGILTFHWAINYGAVLQCYCLQQYLKKEGYDVEVINYKPKEYDFSLLWYLKMPQRLVNVVGDIRRKQKDKLLAYFRNRYLIQTDRIFKAEDILEISNRYDIVISGSDQVLNPTFLMRGEENNITTVYYLSYISQSIKKVGYAVSFGCQTYPNYAISIAKDIINNFDFLGTREESGKEIAESLCYNRKISIVPDPTILYGRELFQLLGTHNKSPRKDHYCLYMLRHKLRLNTSNVICIDDNKIPISLECWLNMISSSQGLITNSYHGMIMAILSETPFVVILENSSMRGMNDRFYTLLNILGLLDRIIKNNDEDSIMGTLKKNIDWNSVNSNLKIFRQEGINFFKSILT